MRKTYLMLAGAGAVLLAACSGGKKAALNDDLKKDLELASSNDGITLANSSGNAGTQVMSAIERTTPPVRQQTPTTRVRRHRAAPKAPPQVVETEALATVTEPELQSVAPAPADDQTVVSPRPHPVAVSSSGGASSGGGGGGDIDRCDPRTDGRSSGGSIIGTIFGAVIRGGVVGGVDNSVRRPGRTSVNNRIPFPGRVGGTSSSGGRASGPTIGGISVRTPRR
jgi:hypothetical protein